MTVGAKEKKLLAIGGAKLHLCSLLLKHGFEGSRFKGIVSFHGISLKKPEGFICDAMAVAVPAEPGRMPEALENSKDCTYGLFIHIVNTLNGSSMTWAHINNIGEQDILTLLCAVRDACTKMKH